MSARARTACSCACGCQCPIRVPCRRIMPSSGAMLAVAGRMAVSRSRPRRPSPEARGIVPAGMPNHEEWAHAPLEFRLAHEQGSSMEQYKIKRAGGTSPRARLAIITLLLSAFAGGASMAADYGNCEVSGVRGSVKLETVVPGALSVRPTLPAPGWWNGDSPDTIKDGFEYCMAANMAYR